MSDFGVRVALRLLTSPLWTLSPRALRLWLFLAAKSQHAVTRYTMADGQKVPVSRGQWLTSRRRLQADVGYRSPSLLVGDLDELRKAGAISCTPVIRERFRSRTTSGSENEPGGWFRSRTTGHLLATLITVHGINQLVGEGGSESEPKERQRDPYGLSRDAREWALAEQKLKAEGR